MDHGDYYWASNRECYRDPCPQFPTKHQGVIEGGLDEVES